MSSIDLYQFAYRGADIWIPSLSMDLLYLYSLAWYPDNLMEAAKMMEAEATMEVVVVEGLSTEEVRQWWRIANTATAVATIVGGTTAA